MSMANLREHYDLPWLKRGARVSILEGIGGKGTVTSATHYVRVRLDDTGRVLAFHPNDLTLIEEDGDAAHG